MNWYMCLNTIHQQGTKCCSSRMLTRHWRLNKMADILQTNYRIYFDSDFIVFVPGRLIDNKSALVQVMACCQTGSKPLPVLMTTQFIDISLNIIHLQNSNYHQQKTCVGNYIFGALTRKQMSLICFIQNSTSRDQFYTHPAQNTLALVSVSFPHWKQPTYRSLNKMANKL